MAESSIRVLPDPVLRQKAKRVSSIDGSVQRLVDRMLEAMHRSSGVGVAAPQIGVSLRVIVIGLPDEEQPMVLINPQIVKRFGERVVDEGCLSIPGYQGEIKRSARVVVKGLDRQGKEIRIKASDLLAQALEHEIDHLNGVLYVDHLESRDKLRRLDQEESGTVVAPQQ